MRRILEHWLGDTARCVSLLVALGFLKALLYVGFVGFGVTRPFVGTNAQDLFLPVADRLVDEHRFNGPDTREDSKVAPAYPFLIAVLKVARVPALTLAIILLQIMADAITGLCLLGLGRLLGNTLAGGIAGLAWSLYPPATLISTWITPEPIFTTLLMGSILLLLVSLTANTRSPGLVLGAGILMGAATLFRATPMLIWVFLLPAWISRQRYLEAVIFACAMCAFILPWTVRNSVVLHDRIAVSTGTGNVLLLGSEEEQITASDKKEPFYEAAGLDGARNGIFKPNPEYGSAIDAWYTRIALLRYRRLLQTNPLGFIRLFLVKGLRLWYATDTATMKPQVGLALCSLPFVSLGLWQVWRWRKAHRLFFLVGGGVLVYFIGMHVVLLPLLRYMIPVYPILILAASHWLCERLSLSPPVVRSVASTGQGFAATR